MAKVLVLGVQPNELVLGVQPNAPTFIIHMQ
jgi:hypothetical protein